MFFSLCTSCGPHCFESNNMLEFCTDFPVSLWVMNRVDFPLRTQESVCNLRAILPSSGRMAALLLEETPYSQTKKNHPVQTKRIQYHFQLYLKLRRKKIPHQRKKKIRFHLILWVQMFDETYFFHCVGRQEKKSRMKAESDLMLHAISNPCYTHWPCAAVCLNAVRSGWKSGHWTNFACWRRSIIQSILDSTGPSGATRCLQMWVLL